MLEASHRGYWHADAATLHLLATTFQQLVQKYGASGGQLGANNDALKQYIAQHAAAPAPGAAVAPGKAGLPARLSAPLKASARAAASSLQVTGQALARTQSVAQTAKPLPQLTAVNRLALFVNLAAVFALLALGYTGRRGAI
jgi:cobalamin biosynthesis Mg chelatase CobN